MGRRYLSVTMGVAVMMAVAPGWAASPPPVPGENGMVATAQHLASRVGADILRKGGNAVDAAVAVGYALAVVYPAAGNLGGGGFMTIRFADGRTTFLDFREKAPLAATETMYLAQAGNPSPKASTRGHLAVGVPGSVAGFETALAKYGTLKRDVVMAPAISYAENGYTLLQGDVNLLNDGTEDFKKDPATAAIFLKNGAPYQIGDTLVQKDLANTLRQISEKGAEAFYKGPIADEIVRSSKAGGGILSKEDFEQYNVRELKPIECNYKGYTITSAPPPSSGGVVICQILNILEGYPLKDWGFNSAQTVHHMVEAMRHAYVDRNSALGDPDFVQNPIDRLLDKKYAEAIRAVIPADKAANSKDVAPGTAPHEGTNTTHYSITDKDGNAVAVTYTLNDWFGARVTAGSTGILLNDEMDDFTIKPGVPNLYGLVQGKANAIAPGKRPLSSMSPTIVSKDGRLTMVVGSPGGSRIITITLQTILNVLEHGMDIQQATDAPRIHHQWQPDVVYAEPFALSADTRKLLEGMGHKITEQKPWGDVDAVLVGGPALGQTMGKFRYFGANDNRRQPGEAVGY